MQSSCWCVLTIVVLALLSDNCALSVNPGFKARLTQKGINYLRDVGLGILKKELSTLPIPDISGSAHISVGKVDYTVSNMRLNTFNIPSANLTPNPTIGGLQLDANSLSLAMSGNWKYKAHIAFIPVKDHGTFDVSASGISLRVAIRIGMDSSGRPTVSSQSSDCSFNIGSLKVKFHGGASWIYNLFDSAIESSLKKSLVNQIGVYKTLKEMQSRILDMSKTAMACDAIRKEVNDDLAKEVAKLQVVAKIDDIAEIDYSLVSPPTFQGSINMANKGEVYPIGKRDEAPFPVPPIPADPDTSNMLELWATQFLFESAGYVYFKAGFFQYNLTQDKLPPGGKISLNTSSLTVKLTIPEVSKLFPNMLMQVNVNASRSPDAVIKPDALNGTAVMDAVFFVQLPNKTLHYICTMELTAYASANLGFKGNNITWNAKYIRADVKLLESNIGKIDLKMMKGALDTLIPLLLIPWLNEEGKQGIPLPTTDDIHFENPVLKLEQGYFKLGVDVRYDGKK